ncbi:MAG: PDDEXK nuclease domain-containing protein [Candidatus Margulisbacteria bacterium]|jgi:predicted nuclease of restriction endonuclease-like (RecB) superfamily|nr:PDDEXK nuclease domain-containing protein [Candidatus Margulisiibacteriota bacterium]
MAEILDIDNITKQIKLLIEQTRSNVAREVNQHLVKTYWKIGRLIVDHEQNGDVRAQYGKQLLKELAKKLTKELGTGFSRSNLQNMRNFYLAYPICQTVSGKLSWSHICELLIISDKDKRSFYEQECLNSGWSVRELKRQIETSLFERLLLSDGQANKQTILTLSKQGVVLDKPQDILKDPYVFEFLGVREEKPLLEKDLEYKLIRHIEDFLLELGRGFMFVGSQQRITLGSNHYYVDMVFYNKMLKAYVLIDLKTGHLTPEHIGQMNMYLNYYNSEVKAEDDQQAIGIVLCADKHDVMAEYALGGLENNIFASRYTYYIPDKEQLISEVRALLAQENTEQ